MAEQSCLADFGVLFLAVTPSLAGYFPVPTTIIKTNRFIHCPQHVPRLHNKHPSSSLSPETMKEIITRKRVTFNAKNNVVLYNIAASSDTETNAPNTTRLRVKDPLPKERRMQQLVARKAVLSFQRQLRQRTPERSHEIQDRLAHVSAKFSHRARDVALEEARMNFLEAHPTSSDDKCPRFCPQGNSVKANTPIQLTEFPTFKLTQKVPLARKVSFGDADGPSVPDSKRQRLTLD